MKRVIIDYLKRWKWPLLGGFILHTILMVLAFQRKDSTVVLAVFMGSAFLLMFEFFRSGGSRTYLSLPLTSKDLARTWRFVALEFPVAYFLVALVLGASIAWLMGPNQLLNIERFAILALFQTLVLGLLFFALTGIQQNAAEQRTWRQGVQGGVFGLIWGFSIPACIFAGQAMPARFGGLAGWHWLVAVCLAILGVVGWFRAEILVLKRAVPINRMSSSENFAPSLGRGERRAMDAPIRGFGGIPFHCWHYARTTGLFGLVILFLNWAVFGIVLDQRGGAQDGSGGFTASQIYFFVPIISMIMALMALVQLRMLRTLPLSRAKLAGVLVLWPMGFAVVYAFVAIAAHYLWFGGPFLWDMFGRSIAGTAAMLLCVPALMRFGFKVRGFICVFVLLPGIQLVQIFFEDWKLALATPWWLPFVLASVLVSIAFALTHRLLESNQTWRAGALRFNAFRRA